MWATGFRPAATFGTSNLSSNPQFAGEDVTGIDNVGVTWGEIDLEKLAALQPDLIVVPSWPAYYPGSHGFADQAQMDNVQAIAPIAALRINRSFDEIFARFGELALALRADQLGVTDQRRKVTSSMRGGDCGSTYTPESWEQVSVSCAGRSADSQDLSELLRAG